MSTYQVLSIFNRNRLALAVSLAIAGSGNISFAEEVVSGAESLDVMSVTATREERESKEVPVAISVIDEKRIENSRMFNVTDALSGTPGVLINSKNGGYDARLIIRGAGLKANYGIREIMMLRDGVPVTDPDSFTRLDFIDTQDIERIEVTKGPGNIYALGSAGGTIQLISKSVFDTPGTKIKGGAGTEGTYNLHARSAFSVGKDDDQAFALTYSHRSNENDWRNWNEFTSNQASIKHGLLMGDDTTLETELSFTKSDLNLPGSIDEDQFNTFKDTGEVTDNNSAFKHSARNSEIWFVNSRLEKPIGSFTYRPRVYLNYWSHFHPVTGVINESKGVTILGTDQEFSFDHTLLGRSQLVGGLTLKRDRNDDSKKYKYADVNTIPSGRITSTLSDEKGDLIETEDETNTVMGVFMQESMRPTDKWLVDLGARYDRINLQNNINEIETYSYSQGKYVTGAGETSLDKDFDLFSANFGVSYALLDSTNVFVNIAQGDQVPFGNELQENPNLKQSTARNFELGLKGRSAALRFDTSAYYITVEDEVIASLVDGQTVYQNAGKTRKIGGELSGSVRALNSSLLGKMWLGGNYAYNYYRYREFTEVVSGESLDRSGNQLPYAPTHQYSLFATWEHASGLTARIQSDTWGEYYLDSANSETFAGYSFVTSLNLGYKLGAHSLSLDVQNLTDNRYAVEVKKDARGNKSYTPGAPRTFLATYQYQFK